MLEFVISIAIGVAVAAAWMAVWALMLRAFAIPVLMRSPEERAARKQRIFQMGKVRYILTTTKKQPARIRQPFVAVADFTLSQMAKTSP